VDIPRKHQEAVAEYICENTGRGEANRFRKERGLPLLTGPDPIKVWNDGLAEKRAQRIAEDKGEDAANEFRRKCGLPLVTTQAEKDAAPTFVSDGRNLPKDQQDRLDALLRKSSERWAQRIAIDKGEEAANKFRKIHGLPLVSAATWTDEDEKELNRLLAKKRASKAKK
jgi:hypothetical protein